jgi:hypothetical protein
VVQFIRSKTSRAATPLDDVETPRCCRGWPPSAFVEVQEAQREYDAQAEGYDEADQDPGSRTDEGVTIPARITADRRSCAPYNTLSN